MKLRKLLAAACIALLASIASFAQTAPDNTCTIGFDPVAGATGYRLFYGAQSREAQGWVAYDGQVDAGATTAATLVLPAEGEYFISARSYSAAGDSIGYGRELRAWPDPQVVNVIANCSPIVGGGVDCNLAVAGFNFSPTIVASINYPGVTVTSFSRLDSRSIAMEIVIEPNAAGGSADIVLEQPWFVVDGTQLPGDDASLGGTVQRSAAAAVVVTPVILPEAPGNLRIV